jgi:serine/threonine-protein kinase
MSIVYLAREVELNRLVAVKVLPLQLTMEPDAAERFKREARISASLDHPNIVPIYQVGDTPTFVWYSMKWVNGRSLRQALTSAGSLPLEECLRLIEPIAGALHHAHRRGIVHRDVKPENILIDETGWVTVCDFGIAKAFGTAPLTPTGGTIGTPGYMSPEQCYGRSLDGRADQYALAILMYECLTGDVPFRANSLGEIVRKHCLEAPPRVNAARPDIPDTIAEALLRAMSKQPEDRFSDVVDFIKAVGGSAVRSTPSFAVSTEAPTVLVPTEQRTLLARLRAMPQQWLINVGVVLALVLTLGLALRPRSSAAPESRAASPPVSAEWASLAVSSAPWGELFVDERHIGPTPLTNVALTPGRHEIRIAREGYEAYRQTLEVSAGQSVKLPGITLRRTGTP